MEVYKMSKVAQELNLQEVYLTYTVKQAAELLHTNIGGIYQLIKAGHIRVLKPRGTTLIYRQDLIDFIENCRDWNLKDPFNPVKIEYGNTDDE